MENSGDYNGLAHPFCFLESPNTLWQDGVNAENPRLHKVFAKTSRVFNLFIIVESVNSTIIKKINRYLKKLK